MRRNRDAAASRASEIVDNAERLNRSLSSTESVEHRQLFDDLKQFADRLDALYDEQTATTPPQPHRRGTGSTGVVIPAQRTPGYVTSEPATHRQGDPASPSFFRDLAFAKTQGNPEAYDRLFRAQREDGRETRALGNTGGVGGSGGEFAPPAWLVDQFIALARPARPTADLMNRQPLPSGVASVNLPKVATGTTTAIQTTQNTALSQTDLTSTSVSSPICTVGG